MAAVSHAIDDGRPKNVIMLLGDGMGDSEITAARYYAAGAGGHLRMDEFPFTGEQTTWSVKLGPPPNTLAEGGAGRAPPRRRCRQAVAPGARAGTAAANAA